jgi:hypothetical protein
MRNIRANNAAVAPIQHQVIESLGLAPVVHNA